MGSSQKEDANYVLFHDAIRLCMWSILSDSWSRYSIYYFSNFGRQLNID